MIITVASGKGGTGKTTVATNLALSCEEMVMLLDCDVEEPNAHIFIKALSLTQENVFTLIPKIDAKKCMLCGYCAKICAFNAIANIRDDILIFSELCHSCGACKYLCPSQAITEVAKKIGVVTTAKKENITFVSGALEIGETIPIPVIKAVKKNIESDRLVIIDAPPGVSCPMLYTVKNSDFCLLVTEPTPFGLSDLISTVDVLKKLNIFCGVIINKYNLGDDETEKYCKKNNIPILMRIPFGKDIAEAYASGIPLIDRLPEYRILFQELIAAIKNIIKRPLL